MVPPVPSAASGGCFGQLDQPGTSLSLTCVHNVVGPTTMQIRNGAAGVNGTTVFDFGDPASPVVATWTSMTAGNIADVLAGNLYISIQTAGRPGGEIRGQILSRTVDTVNFTADGAQVVPPNASAATANCTADLDGPATSLAIQCTHTVAGPVSAHVHEGPFGTTGPAAFTFPSPASPLNANMPMTPVLVADYAATFLYLDIHTAGTDEIRGQIGTPPAAPTTGTIVIEKLTAPAGGVGFGFTETMTPGTFSLDHGATQTFSAVTPGTYSVTEGDPTASNHTLGAVSCDDADSSGDVNTRTATINLAAGETVLCTFRNIETAPTDTIFVLHLSGDQEVPPVATSERGGCMGRFDAAASELTLVCTHDTASPTIMHVHQAPPGANGAIVFDLGSPVSPVIATWSGMTPANVADLLAGNFYVNIHSAGQPGGAIRGQLLPRTVDTVSFTVNGTQVVPPNASAATASCVADLDNTATALAINCTHNLAAPTAAHIHQAPRGANGPVAFTFPSAASPLNDNMPMTPRLVADFAATFLHLDIHTAGTEQIRGQIDSARTLAIDNVTQVEGNAGTTNFVFTVTLTGSTALTTTVNYATADGTAAAGSDYTATSGTLTFDPGMATQTISVPVIGETTNEVDETFTVTLSSPTNATITTATGTGTIQNDDTQPALTIDNVSQVEGNAGTTNFIFTVTLSPASGQTVMVNHATADGTATVGSDYTDTSGTLTFAPGVTTQMISVPVTGDTTNEADETFTVTLSSPTDATITNATGTGTIQNDDAQPALTINNVNQVEGNAGTTNFIFTVTLSPASGQTVMVNHATADGTATVGSDYTDASGTLTFAPGVTTQMISVPVTGDTTNEADETFTVTLSSPTNVTITTATGTGTIQNDDGQPALTINNVSQVEGNAGTTNFLFTVALSPASGQTVMVNFATADGTATAGSDYTAASGTLTFAPGVTTQNFNVLVNGDAVFEADEMFAVNLSAPINATITTATGTGSIVNDEPGNADLAITKTATGNFYAGLNTTFNIAVTNGGPNDAVAVVVTDVLPADVTFVSATPSQGSCSGTTTVTCNLGTINNAGNASIALTVRLDNQGPLSNTATVSAAPQPDPNSANSTSTATLVVLPAAAIPALDEKTLILLAAFLATVGFLTTGRKSY
jgi:hypothetical protein